MRNTSSKSDVGGAAEEEVHGAVRMGLVGTRGSLERAVMIALPQNPTVKSRFILNEQSIVMRAILWP
jgi:hypothetical protein